MPAANAQVAFIDPRDFDTGARADDSACATSIHIALIGCEAHHPETALSDTGSSERDPLNGSGVMRLLVGCCSTCWRTRWGEFALGGVGSVVVVVDAPVFDEDLGFGEVSKWRLLRNSSRKRPLNDSIQAFSQGEPGSMKIDLVSLNRHQSATA